MRTTLVTSTEEASGKTAAAIALAQLAAERDATVGYMKPKGTRLESNVGKTIDADPLLARELLGIDAELEELEPVVYSPTFVEGAIRGREDPAALHDRIEAAFEGLSQDVEHMFVEGGATLTTGGVVDLTDVDVADLLDARMVLLSRYTEPGDVDDVLAAADLAGDRLDGVVFNAVGDVHYDTVDTDVAAFLERRDIPVLGVLPRTKDLAGVTVGNLADALGADLLTETATDAYVERFYVGAMTGESALRHLRRTKDAAVITGGDRSDVHTAALQAPGVNCLILTGGFRPSSAILGRAEEAGLPVLLVQSDTLTTVERAEQIVDGGRVRDEVTVEKMADLLSRHANVEALVGAASD